jgi:hypothetical protein
MRIIVAQPDIFDYGVGEPPAHVITVLRALDVHITSMVVWSASLIHSQVDNEWVKRLLINHSQIERLLLADIREHAERLLNDYACFTIWTADGLRVQRFVSLRLLPNPFAPLLEGGRCH